MNYLTDYQPFESKKELNEAVSSHFDRCNFELNETDREVLLMLSRYSVKYPGVAHLKTSTIAEKVKKSNRTVQRTIRKLEALLIIEKKPFLRQVSGGFGANLYIFLPPNVISELSPRKEVAKPDTPTTEATISENEPILSISNKDLYIHNTYEQVTVTHYTRFKNCIQSFKGEDNQPLVSRLYGIYRAKVLRLLKFDIHKGKKELLEALSIQAIKITFQATKKKTIRNLFGYYDGVLRELIDKALFSDAFMDYDCAVEMKIPNKVL
ncbi:helix-turn-helix domain-containing protein [Sporosarcina sp. G11-34]|uniref:helix-turn-helix domain-containing protein n=1 Tax=Sporosarcina sp. G11-34 TaxID=2849605 RepID=UPI0022A9D59E|nr:helix-turn-helix domain-containing protein [Sporosarcina sp. G11-34]MCZ2259140.1 helix-turn-helix domain-containing protein [Sporosarcina sp. G11-34]